jgi:hypothetical protein
MNVFLGGIIAGLPDLRTTRPDASLEHRSSGPTGSGPSRIERGRKPTYAPASCRHCIDKERDDMSNQDGACWAGRLAGLAAGQLALPTTAFAQTVYNVAGIADFTGPYADVMKNLAGGRWTVFDWWNEEVGKPARRGDQHEGLRRPLRRGAGLQPVAGHEVRAESRSPRSALGGRTWPRWRSACRATRCR